MGGNHKTTRRHYQYLNSLGYNCVSFNLVLGSNPGGLYWHPLWKYALKGVFFIWTKQIVAALDEIPGDKILYAFSGPSLSALSAVHNRSDIKKVICDGGPFTDTYANTQNFFEYEMGFENRSLVKVSAWLGTMAWGHRPLDKLSQLLKTWPLQVPILSIRGLRDNIVAVDSIRKVFAPHTHIDLQTLELAEGKHLDGLRDFPEQYKAALKAFL